MLKKIGSVKLAIVLLVFITIGSIVGTLIPQNLPIGEYISKYGEPRYRLMEKLQLTDVYHSIWYMGLLAAFCANLIACSIQNFRPLIKSLQHSSSMANRFRLSELPFHEKIELDGSARGKGTDETARQIKSILNRRFYKLKHSNPDTGLYYFERGKIGRLGPLMTHTSIVVILLGGILVGVLGSKDVYIGFPVGWELDIPHAGFKVKVDDFDIEYNEGPLMFRIGPEFQSIMNNASIQSGLLGQELMKNGLPLHDNAIIWIREEGSIWQIDDMDSKKSYTARKEDNGIGFYPIISAKKYKSEVTITEGDYKYNGAIEMNHPLEHKGTKLYQSSYDYIGTVRVQLLRGMPQEQQYESLGIYDIEEGSMLSVPGSQLRIKVTGIYLKAIVEGTQDGRRILTNRNENLNPAATLELYEDDVKYGPLYGFLRFPDFHQWHQGSEGTERPYYSLRLLDIYLRKYPIFQISQDPGLSVVWLGAMIMVVGMFLSFYSPFKRIWIRVSKNSIEMGARSYKNRAGFQKEFERLKVSLGESDS